MNEKDYLWYKLCVYYHANTEIYDRELTDLRSPIDSTEAYIVGEVRSYSNAYALKIMHFIYYVARRLRLGKRNLSDSIYYKFSAQGWIDEYHRLVENGEMAFIDEYKLQRIYFMR